MSPAFIHLLDGNSRTNNNEIPVMISVASFAVSLFNMETRNPTRKIADVPKDDTEIGMEARYFPLGCSGYS
ncbi:MAG: hypothetical protein U5L72_03215 [Bacteroidales bacterium]|nr:hypothetical protein [Bacteroidales bacterium]